VTERRPPIGPLHTVGWRVQRDPADEGTLCLQVCIIMHLWTVVVVSSSHDKSYIYMAHSTGRLTVSISLHFSPKYYTQNGESLLYGAFCRIRPVDLRRMVKGK
jgi:hypothetical protein